ncbi:hypothetical protein QFZ32_009028 [Streptomyces canus]|nr:hypothetical protein [Streptomyces canus]MDQ1073500.1 hypothetical protein [Streptomyces canus]
MHELARLPETERRRLVDAFLDAVFVAPDSEGIRSSMTPELPDRPTEEQLQAWVELAELTLDPDFRTGLRRTVEAHRSDAATPPRPDVVALARVHAEPALESGIAPESPEADPLVTALCAHCARALDRSDDTALHRHLLNRLETAHDPHRDRYLELLAVINACPAPGRLSPALAWSTTALRARTAR